MATTTGDVARDRTVAVDVLCDPSLAHVVDLIAHPDGPAAVVVANAGGAARLSGPGETEVLRGRNPVERQDPFAFTPITAEVAEPWPPNADNSYPWAYERLVSL